MTEGPPPSAASSSKTPTVGGASTGSVSQAPNSVSVPPSPAVSNPNTVIHQPYLNYATWGNMWSSTYPGYPPTTTSTSAYPTFSQGPVQQAPYSPTSSNPYAAHIFQPHAYKTPQLLKSTYAKPNNTTTSQPVKSPPPPARLPTPPLPDPETYKDWDEVIKKFLMKTKMVQTLKGLENDMLVLSPHWEQTTIPDALKEMVIGLQLILDRLEGKRQAEENSRDVDITTIAKTPDDGHSLEDRKLDYVHLSNGAEPRTQSSINKSISQFLSRTRARNNASNRAEFLHTLAEKRRKITEALAGNNAEEVGQEEEASNEHEITSCARVDAKPIDRDKQIKYDIAKYGEGPLTKTVKSSIATGPSPPATADPSTVSSDFLLPAQSPPTSSELKALEVAGTNSRPQRKRKFGDLDGDDAEPEQEVRNGKPKSTRKGKGKAKAGDQEPASLPKPRPDLDGEETTLSMATSAKHPGIDERLKDVEEHLAIRYVPSPPRTLLARLMYLEDHVIKLEKEYPPWAALHFNQPNRGWPPPPRATPVIVPPHLRSLTTTSTTPSSTDVSQTPSTLTNAITTTSSALNPGRSAGPYTSVKPRKANSSLQKAVLERLEVQKAMNEMGGKNSRD